MLQNINILTGAVPAMTGNAKEDCEKLRDFLERLVRGLEISFDQLEQERRETEK